MREWNADDGDWAGEKRRKNLCKKRWWNRCFFENRCVIASNQAIQNYNDEIARWKKTRNDSQNNFPKNPIVKIPNQSTQTPYNQPKQQVFVFLFRFDYFLKVMLQFLAKPMHFRSKCGLIAVFRCHL